MLTRDQLGKLRQDLRARLNSGTTRISDGDQPLAASWFPDRPHPGDELASDYGVSPEHPALSSDAPARILKQVTSDFWEELFAIQDWVEKNNSYGTSSGSNQKAGVLEDLNTAVNIGAAAFRIWYSYAIPVRVKDGWACRIWPPQAYAGAPIIKATPVESFIIGSCYKTASDAAKSAVLSRRLARWQQIAGALGVLAIILIAVLARQWSV